MHMSRFLALPVLLLAAALLAEPLEGQGGTITGRVLDASTQQPIQGVQVHIAAESVGTLTRGDGRYLLLNVPAGSHELTAERIGYRSSTSTVNLGAEGTLQVSFELSSTAISLDEIVVSGTAGRQERRAQGAQVEQLDAADIVLSSPVRTMAELLQGRAPGVTVTKGTGRPGVASRIRIRGHASISLSNDPLIFIDGVRADSRLQNSRPDALGRYGDIAGQTRSRLDDIDPDQIERIEVVKGPAAATLYGADASAGVIQIFTKRGRSGSFTQTISTEIANIEPNFEPLDAWARVTASCIAAGRTLCVGKQVGDVVSDNPLKRAGLPNHGYDRTLSWSGQGGSEGFTFYLAGDLSDAEGIWPTDTNSSKSFRANFDWTMSDNAVAQIRYGLYNTSANFAGGDHTGSAPILGSYVGNPLNVGDGDSDGWLNRAARYRGKKTQSDETLRQIVSLNVTYEPTDWFMNRLTVGGDFSNTKFFQFWPKNDEGWFRFGRPNNTGRVQENHTKYSNMTVDYLANFTPSVLPEPWSSTVSVGAQMVMTPHELVWSNGLGLTSNATPVVSAAAEVTGGSWRDENREVGFFAQAGFGYDDRAFLQLGARIDQHSAFGDAAPAFFLPKVGVSYVLSEEDFWEDRFSWINTFRLRAAYGTTGRSPRAGASLTTFAPSSYFDAYTGAIKPGVIAANSGNPNLTAERGTELEAGFDAAFLSDRVGLEVTFFNKVTSDLLFARPIPNSLGFTERPWANLGEVLNRGIEVGINSDLVRRPNLLWDARLSMSTLKNELVDMGGVAEYTFGSNEFSYSMREGYPLGSIFTHKIIDVQPSNDRAIVTDQKEFLGSHIPTFTGSASSGLTFFRNLRLYAQADWQTGFRVWDSVANWGERGYIRRQGGVDPLAIMSREEDLRRHGPYFTASGQPVSIPDASEEFAQEGDFIRLREVSIAYTLTEDMAGRMGLNGATLRFGVRNAAILTKYGGADPESISNTATDQFLRYDFFATPTPRRWSMSMRVQF